MFFILSKTLNYLVQPLVIILACFILAVLLRNKLWKKKMFVATLIFFLFFTNDFIANEVMLAWEPDAVAYRDIGKTYDLGILLAGVTRSGNTPDDRVYFQRGVERITHTLQLYRLGKIRRVLVAGGSGRLLDIGEREADDIRSALIMMGVDPVDILVESNSRNTRESAVEVHRILAEMKQDAGGCLLITSAFHMPRSSACFAKVGLEMDTFPTDSYTHPRTFTPDVLFIPKISALEVWHKLTREWTGLIAYKIAGYV